MNADDSTHLQFSFTDVAVATVIAITMATMFTAFSPGMSLVATFVPGVLFAYVVFLIMAHRCPLPPSVRWSKIAPLFLVALGVQFLHFAEEYATGFPERFPLAYGGEPIPNATFVWFNMIAYAIFVLTALASLRYEINPLLMPVLFFVVYGTWGNAISHTVWCVMCRGYFPGAGTALLYFVLGPLLLHAFIPNWRLVVLLLVLIAMTLTACALATFSPQPELAPTGWIQG